MELRELSLLVKRHSKASFLNESLFNERLFKHENQKMNIDLNVLSEFDFTVVVDASGSMKEPISSESNISRWDFMQESLMGFVIDIEKLDSDGIDLVIFNGVSITKAENVTSKNIKATLSAVNPRSSTPLAEALKTAFNMTLRNNKKSCVFVFTDGAPDDRTKVEEVIKEAASIQESDDSLTLLFIQVGDDVNATKFLKYLDDNISSKFDIVDTYPIQEVEKFSSTSELIATALNG